MRQVQRARSCVPGALVIRRYGMATAHAPPSTTLRGLALHDRTLQVADADNHAIRSIDLDTNMVTTVGG